MENKRLEVRLTNEDWTKIYGAKGDKSVSQFVRNAIDNACKNEEKEPRELIQSLREMRADLNYLKGKIEGAEDAHEEQSNVVRQTRDALIQVLELIRNQPTGSGGSDQKIAEILYLIGQAERGKGWDNLSKEQQKWVLDTLKGK